MKHILGVFRAKSLPGVMFEEIFISDILIIECRATKHRQISELFRIFGESQYLPRISTQIPLLLSTNYFQPNDEGYVKLDTSCESALYVR